MAWFDDDFDYTDDEFANLDSPLVDMPYAPPSSVALGQLTPFAVQDSNDLRNPLAELEQLRQLRKRLGPRPQEGPRIINFNLGDPRMPPQRRRQERLLYDAAVRFAQRSDVTDAERDAALTDLESMRHRPMTAADFSRLAELEHGWAAIERDLQAGIITPEQARIAAHRISVPLGLLHARQQADEQQKRQLSLRMQDEQIARLQAINQINAKLSQQTAEERIRLIPLANDMGSLAVIAKPNGGEQVLHLRPQTTQRQAQLNLSRVENNADVVLRNQFQISETDPRYVTLRSLEIQAARNNVEKPLDLSGNITATDIAKASVEYQQYLKAFHGMPYVTPEVDKRMRDILAFQAEYRRRSAMSDPRQNAVAPARTQQPPPGTPPPNVPAPPRPAGPAAPQLPQGSKWNSWRSADEINALIQTPDSKAKTGPTGVSPLLR